MFSFKNDVDVLLYDAFCKLASDDEFVESIELYVDEDDVVDPSLMILQFFSHELTNLFDYNDIYFQEDIANYLYSTLYQSIIALLGYDVVKQFTFDKEAIFADVEKYSPPLDISHEVLKLMKAIETLEPKLDEAYKDNLLNIDLQDLETVIEALD